MKREPLFREVQRFRLLRMPVLLALPPVSMLLLLIWQVVLGHPWGKQPISNGNVVGWTIFLWLIYFRLITVRLVTEVRSGEVTVAMRGFWRERRIPIGDIRTVEIVNYDAARDYGGYGIRTKKRATACIAGGNRGVRLELNEGRFVLIGSARAEELKAAIDRLRSSKGRLVSE